MRISHHDAQVHIGDISLGPGAALALVTLLESKSGQSIISVDVRGSTLKIPSHQVPRACTAIRKHAALAQVLRGPLNRGPIVDSADAAARVDDIFGSLSRIVDKATR